MAAIRLKEGQEVWVKDAGIAHEDLFALGHVVSIDGHKVRVETRHHGKSQEITVLDEECFHTNNGADVPDHCQLVYLSQPTLLENTRLRFEDDKIYTYVGDILVAVNPFKWIAGLYTETNMAACKGKKLANAECGPHVYSISEKSFVALMKHGTSQCIVVSGESGSGKTETNRQLMNYLVWRGSADGATSDLTQKILDTNPILEAFGNAKTTRNKNSSRFGRYVLVRFKGDKVVGAQVRTFLLERSRVTSTTSAGERSYHVLYQIVVNGKYITPSDPEKHRYLSMSGCTDVDGIDDAEEFTVLNNALTSVGLSAAELGEMWGFVAAMLHLGNLDFGSADTSALDGGAQKVVEGLLGISGLDSLLLQKAMKVGREVTMMDLDPKQAGSARDALVKIMYARLFDFLVVRINHTVDVPELSAANDQRYIGLLDVYGFEFFAVNSFEQLCINFANEKLQQFFLQTVFENEAVSYKEEGVPWTPIAYADNKDIITLCEAGTTGIYAVLDSQCRTPNASGKTFCAALHSGHAKSKVFGAPKVSRKETRSKDDHFIVKHFAGDVVYLATEFLEKNNDSLAAEVEQALLASSRPIVVTICTPPAEAAPSGKAPKKAASSFASVGAKFVKSLKELMSELASSQAHFIRCIKPNPELRPGKLHGVSVIDQLRMSGTLDAVRLIQAGFPSRIPYESLYSAYKSMMPPDVQALPPPEFCEVIAEVCDIGKAEYALGVTKMFFRLGAAAFLEELQEADPTLMQPILLAKLALFEKKKQAKPRVEKTLRMWIHRRRYKVLLAEKRAREEEARRVREEQERKEAEARRRAEEEARRLADAENRRRQEADAKAAAEKAAADAAKKKSAAELSAAKADDEACVQALAKADEMVHVLDEEHRDIHEAVAASGGISGVVAMASSHAESAPVQAQFAGLMRDLCISDEIADEIAASGGVEEIINAAHRHYDAPDVLMEVADAMRNLTHTDAIASRVGAAGGIEILVDASARHAGSPQVLGSVVGALWALSVHDELVPRLVKLGGAQAALSIARALPKDEEVQGAAAALVRNLAVNEDVRWTVAEQGGIELLISAAEAHPSSAEVCGQVSSALWNLSRTEDVASEIAASGSVEILVAAATAHPTDAQVQLGVAGSLRHLVMSDAAADLVITAGGLPVLITASKLHLKRSDVQRAVVVALWELAQHGFDESVMSAEGIGAVLHAAEAHPRDERLQARAAGVLRLLAVEEDAKTEVMAMGGVGQLIGAAKRFSSSVAVQADVAGALSNLAVDDECEQMIAQEGGISVLLDALQKHIKSAIVAESIWHALTNLSVANTGKTAIAGAKTFPSLLKGTLEVHASAGRVVEGVASTLCNLCKAAGAPGGGGIPGSSLVDREALETLVWLLRTHNSNAIVALSIVGALRSLSADTARAKELLGFEVREALKACMMAHLDDIELKREVTDTLRRLEAAETGVASRLSRLSVSNKTRNALGGSKPKRTPGTLGGKLVAKIGGLSHRKGPETPKAKPSKAAQSL